MSKAEIQAHFEHHSNPCISSLLNKLVMSSRHLVSYCMRLLRSEAPAAQRRGLAGHVSPPPKPDTSMDHVFGDNSYKVDFDVSDAASLGVLDITLPSSLVAHAVQSSSGIHNFRIDSSYSRCLRLPCLDDGIRGEQDV